MSCLISFGMLHAQSLLHCSVDYGKVRDFIANINFELAELMNLLLTIASGTANAFMKARMLIGDTQKVNLALKKLRLVSFRLVGCCLPFVSRKEKSLRHFAL